ncbi:hypothetical protein F7642_00990 [Tenacibaculum finnmarkense genomovar ulcerans]|uniref:hypothetical protein n=1 Tax=Tenacibaculum finnmarkense TaxID=2781243 RepID=UPI0007390DF8|nr:hypothetical protein [Tenacibaculum finnmarkense]ALU75512.1 hypothetical protein AUW17_09660 [Tenacibaculum dicentrarchi]MBE7632918.1 hypothetical protein [Tenacibaculum finnmarkense genomovar ulcerans]MCD8428787.1 hypothetical protein [Tenacibaculum finnmarkense genomovar ulcerans]
MENIFRYYEFSDFIKDESAAFSGNEICYAILNEQHFLIFEKNKEIYNLYVSKYNEKKEIGVKTPEILEVLVENYDKAIPAHRVFLRKYLY